MTATVRNMASYLSACHISADQYVGLLGDPGEWARMCARAGQQLASVASVSRRSGRVGHGCGPITVAQQVWAHRVTNMREGTSPLTLLVLPLGAAHRHGSRLLGPARAAGGVAAGPQQPAAQGIHLDKGHGGLRPHGHGEGEERRQGKSAGSKAGSSRKYPGALLLSTHPT